MESHIISWISLAWTIPSIVGLWVILDALFPGKTPIYGFALVCFGIGTAARMITKAWANSMR